MDGIDFSPLTKLVNVSESDVKCELASFASLFLAQAVDEPIEDVIENEDEESFGHEDEVDPRDCKKRKCNQCFACCYQFLLKFRLNCSAFENLAKVYVFLMTLSFSQVSCERAFSTLKLIKTRLRSTISQDIFEGLMLMSVEFDVLNTINFDVILEEIIKSSAELRRHLSC